jgi:phosphoesterase RecJ-like protein
MIRYPYDPPADLLDVLKSRQSFWLATHVYPDSDGMGSMLAMGQALQSGGKDVVMIVDGECSRSLEFLPGFSTVTPVEELKGSADAFLVFDCHELKRTGSIASRLSGNETVVIIDHHISDAGKGDGDIRWQVPQASATAALVQSIIAKMDGVELTKSMATCLYAALITDTAGFRLSNTSADTLRAAADLADAGADPATIAEKVLHRRKPESLRLMSRVLDSVRYHHGGKVAILYARQDMLKETGGLMTETEGIVNFFTAADGVQLVALFKEENTDKWRISMRATDGYDVQWVASQFGGGGHMQAAGFDIEAPLEELEGLMLGLLERELERGVNAR